MKKETAKKTAQLWAEIQKLEKEKNKAIKADCLCYLEILIKDKDNRDITYSIHLSPEEKEKVIIRAKEAGVFYGDLEYFDPVTSMVVMRNCRRIWYWNGARSLSQIAQEGVKDKEGSNITVAVDKMLIMGVIEVLYCTQEAIENLDSVPTWKID